MLPARFFAPDTLSELLPADARVGHRQQRRRARTSTRSPRMYTDAANVPRSCTIPPPSAIDRSAAGEAVVAELAEDAVDLERGSCAARRPRRTPSGARHSATRVGEERVGEHEVVAAARERPRRTSPARMVTSYDPVEVLTSNSDIAHRGVAEVDRDRLPGDAGVPLRAEEGDGARHVVEAREPPEAGCRSETVDLARGSASLGSWRCRSRSEERRSRGFPGRPGPRPPSEPDPRAQPSRPCTTAFAHGQLSARSN